MDRLMALVQGEKWKEATEYIKTMKAENNVYPINFNILAAEVLFQEGEEESAYAYIAEGLTKDPFHYELYFMLGNYYAKYNRNKAYLCYEIAAFYAGNTEDEEYLCNYAQSYYEDANVEVRPASIVIVSYNSKDVMMNCINSIRETNPSQSYELVVVDNDSKDGIAEWLEEQSDIVFARNNYNAGFAYACNQGVGMATPGNDIFFLNNDTIVPCNALFWLRMGLYENEKTGAVGCMTNNAANGQKVFKDYKKIEEWLLYATQTNVPMDNYYEKKIWLVGFAMLVKRAVLDKVGLFDLQFGLGNYEDNDLGMRILQAGYELHLCKNCFIYHFGSMGFKQNNLEEYMALIKKNRQILKQKWGFDITYYTHARNEIIELIDLPNTEKIRVLEVGCGAGATLAKIQSMWPGAEVKGIELDPLVVSLAANYMDIIEGNIETMQLEYEKEYFDYIIFADVLEHLYQPSEILKKVIPYLKQTGCILTSIPNIMHVSVLLPLLRGSFDYQDAGILDRTHVRFFTLKNILKLMKENELQVEHVAGTFNDEGEIAQNEELYTTLTTMLGERFAMQSRAYQYVLRARRTNDN